MRLCVAHVQLPVIADALVPLLADDDVLQLGVLAPRRRRRLSPAKEEWNGHHRLASARACMCWQSARGQPLARPQQKRRTLSMETANRYVVTPHWDTNKVEQPQTTPSSQDLQSGAPSPAAATGRRLCWKSKSTHSKLSTDQLTVQLSSWHQWPTEARAGCQPRCPTQAARRAPPPLAALPPPQPPCWQQTQQPRHHQQTLGQ